MKYYDRDSEKIYEASINEGQRPFATVEKHVADLWRLSVRGSSAYLDLEEMIAVQTLLAKAIIMEKQTP